LLISIIIPAYNEAERIVPSLEKAYAYLKERPYQFELIVVDDGSPDRTSAVAVQEMARHTPYAPNVSGWVETITPNGGKGGAVARGMLAAHGDIRIFTDADFSTPIKEIDKIIPLISTGEWDVVIGSRAAQHRELVKKHQPWYREMMGRFFNVLVQAFVFRGFKDTQCGFKGFSSTAAEYIFPRQQIKGFSFDVEALYLAQRHGFKIKEVAIEWYNDERSTVGAFGDSSRMFIELLRIKRLHRDTK